MNIITVKIFKAVANAGFILYLICAILVVINILANVKYHNLTIMLNTMEADAGAAQVS